MSYTTNTYYSKNANGKIIQWWAKVNDIGTIIITTGGFGTSRTIINNSVIPKGKENKYSQAVKEVKAKAKLKEKKGYKTLDMLGNDVHILDLEGQRLYEVLDTRLSINKTDSNDVRKPMKAVQFKPKSFKYPAIVQPKINGFRCTAMLVKDLEGMFATNETKVKLLTKEGHEYVVPHISNNIPEELFDGNTIFDGEIYVHNEILSNIKRRLPLKKIGSETVSHNSLPIDDLIFCIFDLSVPDMGQLDRIKLKDEILHTSSILTYREDTNSYEFYKAINTNGTIINVKSSIIHSDEEAYKHLGAALNSGFEGIVLRTLDAEYMFGGRRTNMMKLKKSLSGEFEILDVIFKNRDSVRTYISFECKNDINDLTFEVTPEGNEFERQEFLNNKEHYIGKLVTCTYYERTVNGLPFHAVGRIREDWDLDKTDINIEI